MIILHIYNNNRDIAKPIIPKRRRVTDKGNLIEIVAWKVPASKQYPQGIKYSFALVHQDMRVIGFDNFNNEGHHMHLFEKKYLCRFDSLEATADIFFRLAETFETMM